MQVGSGELPSCSIDSYTCVLSVYGALVIYYGDEEACVDIELGEIRAESRLLDTG